MRKVYVEAKVKLVIRCDDDASVEDVVNELEYSFTDTTGKATVEDTEILDFTVKDSK